MVAGPPTDGTLDGAAAKEGEYQLERERGHIGGVGPESVVAWLFVRFLSCSMSPEW